MRFCTRLSNFRGPNGYCANIASCVSLNPPAIGGLKSHDHHVLMQNLFAVSLRGLLPKGPRLAVTRVCNYFNRLCQRAIDPDKLISLESEFVETMCQMERFFPPSLFEIIAEGLMCSTDPKALVNNIPLGPNAAIVKIDVVFKEAVYLWRPTFEMFLITDALGVEIAWPIDKVELVKLHSRDESVKGSPGSGSTSSASKKGAKKKCILMDCNKSGDKVAEGRLCSTDPTDLVHFKSLGPNATKVWVEVSDAIGTTVAWPNDKIVYL